MDTEASRDTAEVYEIISKLQNNHAKIWFDKGLEIGGEWPEEIANHLINSSVVLVMLSSNSIQSSNVRREVNLALSENKSIIVVRLDEVSLSPGMKLQFGLYQMVLRSQSQARAMALSASIMDGANEEQLSLNDIGREMILPFLKLQRKFENKPGIFGYLTFNNESMDEELLRTKVIVINVPENAEIVLASDGYPRLMTTRDASEEELAKLIKTDPLCYKINIATKGLRKGNISYDDRSYIRFTI